MEEDVTGNNTEEVTDLDQRALTVCAECLVKLLSVHNRLREDFDGLKPQDKLAKGVDTVHEVS